MAVQHPRTILNEVVVPQEKAILQSKPGLMILIGVLIILAVVLFEGIRARRNILLPSAIASSKLVDIEDSGFDEAVLEEPKPLPLTEVAALPFPEPPPAPDAAVLPMPPEPKKDLVGRIDNPPREAEKNPVGPVENPSYEIPIDLQPGGTPMVTNSNIKLNVVLAAWFIGFPSLKSNAAETEKAPPPGPTADSLQKLNRSVEDLKTELKSLKDAMEGLKKLRSDLETDALQIQKNINDIRDLREDIGKLRQDLTRLQSERPEPRTSLYPSTPPATATNKVQVINSWMEPMTVIVDGVSYRLQPGQAEIINKNAMSFDYEVLLVEPLRRRSFQKMGETFTIRIGPR